MKRFAILFLFATLLPFYSKAQKAGGEIHREMIEWINVWGPHTNESALPRVLLFGDSITQGYHKNVEALLKDKAYVVRISGSTSLGDPALLDEMAQILKMYDFDVIHFNNGMHGFAYSEDEYAAALPQFYRLIRAHAPRARLIWASTTAVWKKPQMDEYDSRTDRVRERNRRAAAFFSTRDVVVEDLFDAVGTHSEYYKNSDGVHLNADGYAAAAKIVASNIEAALAKGPYEGAPVEWDVERFCKVPGMAPMPKLDEGRVKAAVLDGVDWMGDKTKFFVYYGVPESADAAHPVPAMVLIHGGGGSAYSAWVQQWVDRGYAAIAMGNNGQLPVKIEREPYSERSKRWALLRGGIHLNCGDFEHGLRPYSDQWAYCAVANIMLAHSFLRSLPGVDADRTGVTGNSWGGYLTLMSAAVDKRYKFAAPLYGCGFYDEFDIHAHRSGPAWERWLSLWDAKHYISEIDVPISWACGTNDFYFSFGALQKSFALAAIQPYKAVRCPMVHTDGGLKGGIAPETYAAADHFLKGAPDLPKCGDPVLGRKGVVSVSYDLAGRGLESVELLYLTTDEGPWQKREWKTVALPLPKKGISVSAEIPNGAKALFFNISTSDGLVASSKALFL